MGNEFLEFSRKMERFTGIDLTKYKEAQMKRRLTTLYEKRGCSNFLEYYHYLQRNEEGLQEFLDRITINVTEFYRNAKRWDVLKTSILPEIAAGAKKLKIWSAACSTGDEPYTLAMIAADVIPGVAVEIVATDLDNHVLAHAKRGLYNERALAELPIHMKRKYFMQEGNDVFRVSEEVKRKVSFKKHNLLADPFETECDLIVCRNVLIYFTEKAKEAVYHQFSHSLKSGGVLFVGSTEQIFNAEKYGFISDETFFYRKI